MKSGMKKSVNVQSVVEPSTSEYTTNEITEHLVTNADIVSEFLPVDIDVVGDKGRPGRVTITPADRPA